MAALIEQYFCTQRQEKIKESLQVFNFDPLEYPVGFIDKAYYTVREGPVYYGLLASTGQYIGTYDVGSDTMTPVTNRIYYIPISIPYSVVLKSIGVVITTLEEGKKFVLGVYPLERGIIQNKIIATGEIIASFIGHIKADFHVGLSAGVYMLVFHTEASTLEVGASEILTPLLPANNPGETVANTHYYEDVTYDGTLPDTPGTLTLASGTVPRIWVKVA